LVGKLSSKTGSYRLFSKQRRAISPIIATVLIIAVTLIAAVAIGGFVFGIFGSSSNVAQIGVTGTAMLAADFKTGGSTSTFTCATTAPATAYITLTNTGTAAATVVSVTITWAGSNNAFSGPSTCSVGGAGSATATSYIVFPTTSTVLTSNAAAGQTYNGVATLSNGATVLFTGTWQ